MNIRPAQKPIALAILSLGLSTLAQGQEAARASADTAEASPTQLDKVVITSGKRSQRQREVAGTITALQGAALEQLGAQDQEDVFKLAPGVQLNKGEPDRALPTIRGVGTVSSASALAAQQGTTGVYIDDVPFTDPWGFVGSADLAPFDLARVEVLRGPQGALYGSASLGGALLYVMQTPKFNMTEFSLLGTANTVSHGGAGYSAYAMANLPLGADAALRVVAFDRQDSGYVRNLGTSQDQANELHQRGGRVIAGWRPARDIRVTATLLSQTTRIDDGFAVSPSPDLLEINTPVPSPRTSRFDLGVLKAEFDLGGATLTSNTAYLSKQSDSDTDATRRVGHIGALVDPSLPALPVVRSPTAVKGTAASQELRLASSGNAPLSYVAGLFYQRSTFHVEGRFLAPGGAAAWGPLGVLLPEDSITHEVDQAVATETAVFADAEYKLGHGFSAGLGGRAYRNTLRYDVSSSFLSTPLIAHQTLGERGFTPKATIKYRFGDQLWYALASKGYRFGGVNPVAGTTFKSDSLWNYETGLRLAPARDVRLDLSAFLLDWSNAQVNAIVAGPIPLNGIANVGKAKVKGLEASLAWQASPALGFNGALAYTDAATSADFTANSGTVVAAGSRLPGTARLQTTLQANYAFAGPLGSAGRVSATHSHVGRRSLTLDSGAQVPGYSSVDARVSFTRDAWELTLFASNLADKRGVAGGQPVQGIGSPSYIDYYLIKPRTVGVSLRYDL